MIALDASVVIAFLDANDAHHDEAAQIIEEHARTGFTMHSLTLAEVLVGAARTGRAGQLSADLRSIGIVTHVSPIDEPLVIAEIRAATGLKMPDCCVLATATHHAASLATFDEQLARAAVTLRVPILPERPGLPQN